MSEPVTSLILQIIAVARERGLSQGELAKRAGLTPVGLSKAKHRGDIRASSLAALAAEVDLALHLVPAGGPGPAAAEAIRSGAFFGTPGDGSE